MRFRFWRSRLAALLAVWEHDPEIPAALFKTDAEILAESGCSTVEEHLLLSRDGS